jgi:c-di-GMP-binding flagellar brake protein YcgR
MGKALAMLTSWFGLDEEPELNRPKPINKETVLRLRELSRQHTFVEVRFTERNAVAYQSLILDVTPLSRSALIDELFPAAGQPVMPGEPIEIVSQSKGMPLQFHSEIISLEMVDGVPAYRIALPEKLQANQRRKYYRVVVPEEMEMLVRLELGDGLSPLCKVNNLSSSGINLKINRDVTQHLTSSHVIEGIRLQLPDNDVINCDLEVRSYEYRKVPNRHTLVGGRLLSVSAPAQKKLDKLLAHLQRVMQKQQNGD